MRISLATALCALLSVPAGAASMRGYAGLVISPAGDRVATIESELTANSSTQAHGRIVMR